MRPPLVVIVGETASGKSALALEIAQKFNGEIISADSWTVYRGFDVGTAKPTAEDRAKVPHHLLDVADPKIGFNAVEFQRLAKEAINDITGRGRLPVLVGGTGLYIDSVIFDYQFLPPSDPALREGLNAMSLDQILERAIDMGLDTEGIDLGNKRRVIRLIENNGSRPTRHELRENTLVIGTKPERTQLHERIYERVDAMLRAGLETEVKSLVGQYGWGVEPMKGIGYSQWRNYFMGSSTLEETRQRIVKDTLSLAKRQRTWFKRNNSIQWIDDHCSAVELITTFLNK
ncbi:MAG: tRNA (adenosine(37)-N6)-dimethylallyltransferase MiaA [Candidatus Saccharimonadales bacterium]